MAPIKKVAFLGSKNIGLKCLREMHAIAPEVMSAVIAVDDREDPRTVFDRIRDFCAEHKIALYIARRRRDADAYIKQLTTDLCIMAGWYWLMSGETLRSVGGGIFALHNSLLPKYRGWAPFNWAIINDEKEIGITLFYLTEEMDTGDICGQESMKLKDSDYIADVLEEMGGKAALLMRKHYRDIIMGRAKLAPQDHSKATYTTRRYPQDGRIDWNKPSREVYNFIRAQSRPYPGAFIMHEGKKMIVWRACLGTMVDYAAPGQVAKIAHDGVYVVCGDNRPVVLQQVEIDGKTMPAEKAITSLMTRL